MHFKKQGIKFAQWKIAKRKFKNEQVANLSCMWEANKVRNRPTFGPSSDKKFFIDFWLFYWVQPKNHEYGRWKFFSILPLRINSSRIFISDGYLILEIPFLWNSIFYIFIIPYNDLILFNFYYFRGKYCQAIGKDWHPECFVCQTPGCGVPLQQTGFIENKGTVFCRTCFERDFAYTCAKCGEKIIGVRIQKCFRIGHSEVGDNYQMLMTEFRPWWHFRDFGQTKRPNLTPTSKTCH